MRRAAGAGLVLVLATANASATTAAPPGAIGSSPEPVRARLSPAMPSRGAPDADRIARIVRRAGLAEIERIRREGDRVLVDAISGDGAAFRLALDASSGDIIGRERLGWARFDHSPPAPALQARGAE